MLKNDIIEESQSNLSFPCILVPKHDGGVRFCTDFRKVNDKTKFDFVQTLEKSMIKQSAILFPSQNRKLHRSNWQCQVCQHV